MPAQEVSWNITKFQPNEFDVKFNFSAPKNVSRGKDADLMVIQVLDITTFAGVNGELPSSLFIATQIPRQIEPNSTEELIAEIAVIATESANGLVAGNFVVNLLLSASLN